MNAGRDTARTPKPRSRRIRRIGIGLAVAAAVPILGLATLPYWFPTQWLRQIIALQLAQLSRRDVQVGQATLDWSDGVEIRDIRISDDATRGGRLLVLDAVRCGLTPWRWFRGEGLDQLELIRPELFVQIDAQGRVNLASLPPPAAGKPITTRIMLRDATVHVAGPEPRAEPVIGFTRATLTLDARGGLQRAEITGGSVRRAGGGNAAAGTWSARADLREATGKVAAASRAMHGADAAGPFLGDVQADLVDVDLACLPLGWREAMHSRRVEGRCSGSLRLTLSEDLNHAFSIDWSGRDIRYDDGNGGGHFVRGAALSARGQWRSTQDVVQLSEWKVSLPWIEAHGVPGDAPPLVIALRGETPLTTRLRGRVTDAAGLCRELGVDASVAADGACDFEASLNLGRNRRRLALRVSGNALALRASDAFDLPRGCPVDVSMNVEADEPLKVLRADRFDVRVGSVRVEGKAKWARGEPGRAHALDLRATLATHRAEEMLERVPELRRSGVTLLRGGVRMEVESIGDQRFLQAAIMMESDSEAAIGSQFAKPRGRSLLVSAGMAYSERGDAIERADLSVRFGDGLFAANAIEAAKAGDGESAGFRAVGSWLVVNAAEVLSLSPDAMAALRQRVRGEAIIDGDACGDIQARWARAARGGGTAAVNVDVGGLELQLADRFCKPTGMPACLAATASWTHASNAITWSLDGDVQLAQAAVLGSAQQAADETTVAAVADIADIAPLRTAFPDLGAVTANVAVAGNVRLAARAQLSAARQHLVLEADATSAAVRAASFAKSASSPMHVWLDTSRMRAEAQGANVRFGPSRVEMGESVIAWSGRARLRPEATDALWGLEAIEQADMNGAARIDTESAGTLLGEEATALLARHDVHGTLRGDFGVRVDADQLEVRADCDAVAAAGRWPGRVTKRSGQPLRIEATATWPRADFVDRGRCGGVETVQMSGDAWRVGVVGRGLSGDTRAAMHAAAFVGIDDARRLGEILQWGEVELRGGKLHGYAEFRVDEGGLIPERSRCTMDDFAVGIAGRRESLQLDGSLDADNRSVRSNRLVFQAGRTDATLAVDLRGRSAAIADGVTGAVALSARNVDMAELPAILDLWRNQLGLPKPQPVQAGEEKISRGVQRFAMGSDLHVDVRIRDAFIPTLAGAGPFHAKELAISPTLVNGRLRLPFDCSVNGGVVTGSVATTLDNENPWFDLEYAARRLSSEPNTRPLVEAFFPGLLVTGPITLIDATHQRMFDRPGVPNAAVGTGEMILEGGTVVGRAAPLVIARIFPGLNLAKFDFARMENRFEKDDAGHMHNHMVFFGRYYDMYVDGVSFSDGRLRYEVGVDLYASLLPNLSRQGQGRIALFIKTGMKGPGNTMLDETVWYLRPDQIMAKILSDNVLTHAYYSLKRAIVG